MVGIVQKLFEELFELITKTYKKNLKLLDHFNSFLSGVEKSKQKDKTGIIQLSTK